MTVIRLTISVFMLALLLMSAKGWQWTSQNQPPAKALASHIVLGIGAAAGVGTLVAIWRPRRTRHGATHAPRHGDYDAHG